MKPIPKGAVDFSARLCALCVSAVNNQARKRNVVIPAALRRKTRAAIQDSSENFDPRFLLTHL